MTGARRVRAHDVLQVCVHSTCSHRGHVVRGENFFFEKDIVHTLYRALRHPCSSKGFRIVQHRQRENNHGLAWVGRHWQQWPGIDSGVPCY